MMRTLILLLAMLAFGGAAQAPAPLAVQATARRDGAAVVAWQPPEGQALACAFRYRPLPMEPLDCVRGGASALVYGPAGDAGLRVAPGDTVEVRTYDARGRELGRGRAVIRWRVWMPAVAG